MDTVGNGQFDLPDLEAIYDADKFEPSDVERFLRYASLYMLRGDEDVDEGDTADGPGDISWVAMQCDEALSDPPRPTIRWVPQDGSEPPSELLERGEGEEYEEDDFQDDPFDDEDEDDLPLL